MTTERTRLRLLAARLHPRFAEYLPSKDRGPREDRVPIAPAARVQSVESTRSSHRYAAERTGLGPSFTSCPWRELVLRPARLDPVGLRPGGAWLPVRWLGLARVSYCPADAARCRPYSNGLDADAPRLHKREIFVSLRCLSPDACALW
jgi:hypothetical protein